LTSTNNNVGTNELEVLPVPKTMKEHQKRKIIALVQRLQRIKAKSTKAIAQSDEYKQLNDEIYALYEMSKDEIKLIVDQLGE
jgi:hypothetical protein